MRGSRRMMGYATERESLISSHGAAIGRLLVRRSEAHDAPGAPSNQASVPLQREKRRNVRPALRCLVQMSDTQLGLEMLLQLTQLTTLACASMTRRVDSTGVQLRSPASACTIRSTC